jgi:hypothetical protein
MTDSLGSARTGAAVSHIRSQVQHLNVVDLTGLVTQEPAGQLIGANRQLLGEAKGCTTGEVCFPNLPAWTYLTAGDVSSTGDERA